MRHLRQSVEADNSLDPVCAPTRNGNIDSDEGVDMIGDNIAPASADHAARTSHIGQTHQSPIE
jgi:hypothetical protein